jgi:hypothetical protein
MEMMLDSGLSTASFSMSSVSFSESGAARFRALMGSCDAGDDKGVRGAVWWEWMLAAFPAACNGHWSSSACRGQGSCSGGWGQAMLTIRRVKVPFIRVLGGRSLTQ